MIKTSQIFGGLLALLSLAGTSPPNVKPPGNDWQPPVRETAPGAPLIYEHTPGAGPDESFFLVGGNLATNLVAWGGCADNPAGREWLPRVQFWTHGCLAATLPERAQDGLFLVWVRNPAGWSAPVVLNAPQPWWCGPDEAAPGQEIRVFGRQLARRPDSARAFVYLCPPGKPGQWAAVTRPGAYAVSFRVPENFPAGPCEVWLHAGTGGKYGWGGPARLRIQNPARPASGGRGRAAETVELPPGATGADIQRALDALAAQGGGQVRLPAGQFAFGGTLRIPAQVTLAGSGRESTVLQLVADRTVSFPRLGGSGWNQAPGAIHSAGDTMEYQLDIPRSGDWRVWLRYATDMQPWNQPGVSGSHTLTVDQGEPVPLENLGNTGGWGAFRWAKSAQLRLAAGRHKLVWKNVKGGGITLDAFLFALDPAYVPSLNPPPSAGPGLVVLQGEDCSRFATKEGVLPGGNRAAAWLSGHGAGLRDLTILGNAQVNYGLAVGAAQGTVWLTNCVVERVRVADCDGKQGENCGAWVRYASHCRLADNELWGRAPLFISGARQSVFSNNKLVPVTRFGGNAEAAILGRTETIEECLFEDNLVASPPGAEAGGPTVRRLLWFSTGHGSITHNWVARNGADQAGGAGAARFGGVAGTDQNVGEMILFEGNHRTAWFGPLAGADAQSITLPKTIPATPDNRLGHLERRQLAYDAAGNETPFWPPDVDDGGEEPPVYEYYATVFSGRGQGQTRRVLKRAGEKLQLDRPWNVAPAEGSIVAVGTAFYQNLVVGNHAPDGMTGIQLWISCLENVVAANTINRQRKPGLFLYANGTTLASSMPRTWNRGLSPLFWNLCEGNWVEECSAGALVTSGDENNLPVEFPRALGNVLRHNSFLRSRTDGVILASRPTPAGVRDTSASIFGTIVEFNVVRDAQTAFHAADGSDASLFRRNHAYFWYPVSLATNPPVAFQKSQEQSTMVLEQNSIEGIHGAHDGRIIDFQSPAGHRRMPE